MLIFIEYDLRKQRNYQPLYDELKRRRAIRVLKSSWCFKAALGDTAITVRERFRALIDADDGLLVTEVHESKWATWNAEGTPKSLVA